jgi:hypothetical protein
MGEWPHAPGTIVTDGVVLADENPLCMIYDLLARCGYEVDDVVDAHNEAVLEVFGSR